MVEKLTDEELSRLRNAGRMRDDLLSRLLDEHAALRMRVVELSKYADMLLDEIHSGILNQDGFFSEDADEIVENLRREKP